MIVRRLNGILEEQMPDRAVCDKVCLGAVLTSSFLSYDKSHSVDETLEENIYEN